MASCLPIGGIFSTPHIRSISANRVHVNPFVNGAVNGWQFSGITQVAERRQLDIWRRLQCQHQLQHVTELRCDARRVSPASCPQSAAIIPARSAAANPTGIPINNQSILGTNGQQLQPLVTCNPSRSQRLPSIRERKLLCSAHHARPERAGHGACSYGPGYFNWDMAVFKNFAMSESKRLQFRMQAYNFLNHPLYSFPSGSNLTLQFQQDPVTAADHAGIMQTLAKLLRNRVPAPWNSPQNSYF